MLDHSSADPKSGARTKAVAGAFAAVSLCVIAGGLVYLMAGGGRERLAAIPPRPNAPQSPTVPALVGPPPSADEYRAATAATLSPFLGVADGMTAASFDAAPPELRDLVEKTQSALLDARVPAEFRDAHLALVLLLDKWKRALDGSAADRRAAADALAKTLADQPWLRQ